MGDRLNFQLINDVKHDKNSSVVPPSEMSALIFAELKGQMKKKYFFSVLIMLAAF